MDPDVEAQLLRMIGRINAIESAIHGAIRSLPGGDAALLQASASVARVADTLEASSEENLNLVAIGMREYLHDLRATLDD